MALYVLPNGRKAVNAMENNTIKLRYNVTGSERKLLVAAMGDILVSKPKYLGAPSFAYEVDYFTIDKNGIVSFDDRADSEEIENLIERLQEQGFAAAAADTENDDIGLVIEMPRASFTDTTLENLKRLVESKNKLIKKALGAETLGIMITDDKVRFPWFADGTDPETVKAYTHFVTALCDMARNQKRVTAKGKETGNDKYAFRCFLLRLGFIGEDYKAERKILLRNLSGSSAFKTPKGGAGVE
jgi:hypothetical protein